MRNRTLSTLLFLPLLLTGCDEDTPTAPRLQTSVAGLLAEGTDLAVGEVLTVTAGEAQAIFLNGGPEEAEYLYVPFNASDRPRADLAVEVVAGNVVSPTDLYGTPSFTRADLARITGGTPLPRRDEEFHLRLREREIRELTPLAPAARARARFNRSPQGVSAQAVPTRGDTIELNANAFAACTDPDIRQARVAYVSDEAIIATDVANPAGGFTDAEFAAIGETFDDLLYPINVEYFGEPTDIDSNDRVIIFYSRAVNDLTEPGSGSYVGGFFFGRDVFPKSQCAASNEAEVLYLLTPDPDRGGPFSKENVLRGTRATVAHELQHLINTSRRVYVNDAEAFEEVWLNEGLSHIAEEIMFYAVTGLSPRENIDLETIVSSQEIVDAFNTYLLDNFIRFRTYLEEPDAQSLVGIDEDDDLPTRGAAWAFLRYAADHEEGPDADFFFELVNDPTLIGIDNVSDAIGLEAVDLMQTWTVSVFTDELPITPFLYQQPSWSFRTIMPALSASDDYPLSLWTLGAGEELEFDLQGGGAAFVRFAVAPGARAVLTTTSDFATPPENLRVSVVRLR